MHFLMLNSFTDRRLFTRTFKVLDPLSPLLSVILNLSLPHPPFQDDYKHRAFWRDAYSPAELSELSSLISEAKANQVAFHYAISPGIDILFSSERDVNCLKKKLQQMQLCG